MLHTNTISQQTMREKSVEIVQDITGGGEKKANQTLKKMTNKGIC